MNIIITGTSRGIGFELAKIYANNGHKVLAISRNTIPLEKLNNQNITNLSIDLANEDQLTEVINLVKKKWKQVDIVINNAGKLVNKPFEELKTKDFLDCYQVNVFAVANLTRILIPYLNKGSHVVTISSMGGIQGSLKFTGLAAYSSSKGAVITLSELLAEEYKEKGIAFNVLALGAVQTEMLEEAFPGYQASINAEEISKYIYNFGLEGNKYFNGKVIQVSNTTP